MDEGLLLIDKKKGQRSTSCVSVVRATLGKKTRVGHAGTLDSPASGLLLLLVGPLTRASSYAMALPKRYVVRAQLGVETDTCDSEGEVLSRSPWQHLSEEILDRELLSFLGCRLQVPPRISAVHVQGKRAHELARQGAEFQIEPRAIWVGAIRRLSPLQGDGTVDIEIDCHQGTYVRSLVRDLGHRLGCGATVAELRRTGLGDLRERDAIDGSRLRELSAADLASLCLSPDRLYSHFTTYLCQGATTEALSHGMAVPLSEGRRLGHGVVPSERFLCFCGEALLSFGSLERESRSFRPRTNIFFGGNLS